MFKKLSTLYKTELEQLLELDIKLDRMETVHEKNMQDCVAKFTTDSKNVIKSMLDNDTATNA